MALLRQINGVGDRGGIFLFGRPTALLVMEDGLALVAASTVSGILAGQGLAGAAISVAQQRRQTKERESKAEDLTAAEFEGQPRTQVLPYEQLTGVQARETKLQMRLTFETAAGAAHLRYAKKLWPADEVRAFFAERLGPRFTFVD